MVCDEHFMLAGEKHRRRASSASGRATTMFSWFGEFSAPGFFLRTLRTLCVAGRTDSDLKNASFLGLLDYF
jgi:hypothetical protein